MVFNVTALKASCKKKKRGGGACLAFNYRGFTQKALAELPQDQDLPTSPQLKCAADQCSFDN